GGSLSPSRSGRSCPWLRRGSWWPLSPADHWDHKCDTAHSSQRSDTGHRPWISPSSGFLRSTARLQVATAIAERVIGRSSSGPETPSMISPTKAPDLTAPAPAPRPWLVSRVPEVTALFWLAKLLTTGMGETTSDWLVHRFNPYVAVAVSSAGLAVP